MHINVINIPTIALLGFTLILVYRFLTRRHNYWKNRGVPYEEPFYLAGNFWEVFSGKSQIGKHLGELYSRYKDPYFGIYILGKPYLVLRDPDIIKNVVIRDFKNFEDRTFACDKNADKMAANSLFIMRNPDWKYIRTKLTPIFTSGKLKGMMTLVKKSAKDMELYLTKFNKQTVEIKSISCKYMTDVVASCFFGFEAESFQNENSEFYTYTQTMFSSKAGFFSLFSYFFAPLFVSIFKLKFMKYEILQRAFISTLKYRQENNFRRNDFIDLLLQLKDRCNEDKMQFDFGPDRMLAQSITFFVAGFETTSNAVAFTLYELCLRKDCQEKLRDEINAFIKDEDDITFEKIQKMKYLDMVLSETLRRYPFGPFLNRHCKEDYVIEQTGLKVDKGTPVLIPLDGLHHDPEYFPEPDIFNPERFADDKKQNLAQACVYMPFGMGPRNCIGDRFGAICAKIGLVYILRKYKVERCEETPIPLVLNPRSPFMVPLDGLKMIVTKL
nr:cytochrome P450 [Agasicles hygrophila]